MARTRLTPFAKLLLVVLGAGALYFGLVQSGVWEQIVPKTGTEETRDGGTTAPKTKPGKKLSGDDVIKIGVVTWGGYAGGQYFNEGFNANTASRFYKDYGLKVEFKVLDDFDASRDAFKSDNVNLLWATIDAFPTEAGGLKEYEPQVVFQADWSRGGDAIVVRRGIKSVSDLKGKKIAVAAMTPSHSFLIWLLNAGDLSAKNVTIVEVPSAIDAADAFKSGTVDAAVVWSPDDADCVAKVPGSKVLQSTKSASHIIADVFIAKKDYIDTHKDELQKLYEGWMRGAAEINADDKAKRKAAGILSDGLGMDEDFCYDAINNVRLVTHGDNQDFFGLNSSYTGVTGEALYSKMKTTYNSLGYSTKGAPSWRLIANKDIVGASSYDFEGTNQNAEGKKTFTKVDDKEAEESEAISTKQVSISFRSGEYKLDENAKYIIDREFVDIAKAFSNARIRIEGNTDNVGNRESNIALSRKRAESVARYLQETYNMPENRFIIVGNGPDKPVAANTTADGKSKNRRTDFELVAD